MEALHAFVSIILVIRFKIKKKKESMINRGGVEDTRLEAKDTKKSEAKDSLFEDRPSRGQSQGPRTQPQVFSKKKGLQKSFSGNLQFIGVARILVGNHKSHAMTSSKF